VLWSRKGDEPPEDPSALFEELDRSLADLERLISQINRTNLQAKLANGTTVTDALAKRDVLKLRFATLKSTVDAATEMTMSRYSRSEIRHLRTVDVASLRQQMDDVNRQHRELDKAIQETNWTTELLE
jgi:hypothetical protein